MNGKKLTVILLSAVWALIFMSCGRTTQKDGATPRQVAYPRMQIYDTVYVDLQLPAGFLVNRESELTDVTPVNREGLDTKWIDIRYPAYDATLHCTFIPVDDKNRDGVVANRMERMMLNIGDNYAEQTEVRSQGGFISRILTATGCELTPVQFLSVGDRWVINGALRFGRESIEADSVLPVVEAVRMDVINAAKSLH